MSEADEMAEALLALLDEVSEGDELWSEIERAIKLSGRSTKSLREAVRRGRKIVSLLESPSVALRHPAGRPGTGKPAK